MKKCVVNNCRFATPSPLPGFSWASIDAFEASLLISVVATSTKLHQILTTSSNRDPQLAMTKSCMKRYLDIMAPAQVCCRVLDVCIKEQHNPILIDFSSENVKESREWILASIAYANNVVVMFEQASSSLKDAGFA
ncbi:hypothetical protein EG329_013499 [Mollisiaceae sp. DMI_Dod_QoI]|nr:hypothetical protein EG329_013499 [Helotiales sp. DMI_Dod_QoI]